MLKIKVFDEPIKTEGYCEDVDLLELFEYETGGYLLLNYKYNYEKDFEEDVVFVEYDIDTGHWVFENDYWEGQEEVYIMGFMNHHYNWGFRDLLKIIKLSNENEVLEKTLNRNSHNIKMLSIEIDKRDTEIKKLRSKVEEYRKICNDLYNKNYKEDYNKTFEWQG